MTTIPSLPNSNYYTAIWGKILQRRQQLKTPMVTGDEISQEDDHGSESFLDTYYVPVGSP